MTDVKDNTCVQTEQKKRLVFLDAAKGVGILAVMFGHITKLGNPVDIWISTFKIVIFFIVAGFLVCRSQEASKLSFKSSAMKRVKALLFPYLSFSIIVILYRALHAAFVGKSVEYVLKHFMIDSYSTISLRGISALWFLPTIFIAEVLFFLVMRFGMAGRICCTMAAFLVYFGTGPMLNVLESACGDVPYALISYPILAVTKGIAGFIFVGVGYLLYKIVDRFPAKRERWLAGIALFIAGIILSWFNEGTLDYNNMHFGELPILFFICALVSSVGWMFVLEHLENYYTFPILTWCGRNSLILMATHGTLGLKNIMVRGWAGAVTLSSKVCLKYYLECTGILCYLLIFEYAIVEFVNRKASFLIHCPKINWKFRSCSKTEE